MLEAEEAGVDDVVAAEASDNPADIMRRAALETRPSTPANGGDSERDRAQTIQRAWRKLQAVRLVLLHITGGGGGSMTPQWMTLAQRPTGLRGGASLVPLMRSAGEAQGVRTRGITTPTHRGPWLPMPKQRNRKTRKCCVVLCCVVLCCVVLCCVVLCCVVLCCVVLCCVVLCCVQASMVAKILESIGEWHCFDIGK